MKILNIMSKIGIVYFAITFFIVITYGESPMDIVAGITIFGWEIFNLCFAILYSIVVLIISNKKSNL